jgi:hypothetical protein
VGIDLTYRNKTATKPLFVCICRGKFYVRFWLILAWLTQRMTYNISILFPPDLTKHTAEAQMGPLDHWCAKSAACSNNIWPQTSHSFILLTFIDFSL